MMIVCGFVSPYLLSREWNCLLCSHNIPPDAEYSALRQRHHVKCSQFVAACLPYCPGLRTEQLLAGKVSCWGNNNYGKAIPGTQLRHQNRPTSLHPSVLTNIFSFHYLLSGETLSYHVRSEEKALFFGITLC